MPSARRPRARLAVVLARPPATSGGGRCRRDEGDDLTRAGRERRFALGGVERGDEPGRARAHVHERPPSRRRSAIASIVAAIALRRRDRRRHGASLAFISSTSSSVALDS
jgi:hypothetical protein